MGPFVCGFSNIVQTGLISKAFGLLTVNEDYSMRYQVARQPHVVKNLAYSGR